MQPTMWYTLHHWHSAITHRHDAKRRGTMLSTETAVFQLGDWHFGKCTETYNAPIAGIRARKACRNLVELRSHLAGYDFDRLVVVMVGDMNDGSGIFPTQFAHQDITDPQAQARIGATIWSDAIRELLLPTFERIEIVAVPGNHHFAGRHLAEAAGWDVVFYHYLADKLESAGIRVYQTERGNIFFHRYSIRGHGFLAWHGHGVRGNAKHPWGVVAARAIELNATSKYGRFDVLQIGHFHVCGHVPASALRVCLSGTSVSDDDYPLDRMGVEAQQHWLFYGVSNDRPVTFAYNVDLVNPTLEAEFLDRANPNRVLELLKAA